jgi:hypothetical protein
MKKAKQRARSKLQLGRIIHATSAVRLDRIYLYMLMHNCCRRMDEFKSEEHAFLSVLLHLFPLAGWIHFLYTEQSQAEHIFCPTLGAMHVQMDPDLPRCSSPPSWRRIRPIASLGPAQTLVHATLYTLSIRMLDPIHINRHFASEFSAYYCTSIQL